MFGFLYTFTDESLVSLLCVTSLSRNFFPSLGTPSAEQRSPAQGVGLSQSDGSGDCVNFLIYPYERLKVTCKDPVADIDVTKREVHATFPSKS